MARYKIVDRSPRFLPVVLDAQLMSGSFEYALDYLIDHQLDLSALDRRYRNDATGSTAYDPRVLLKIILLAYSRGMIGRQMFAIDGVKLPSNASKKKSGTHAELTRQAARIRAFLATHAERRSRKGAVRKSNTTDNDSAKMATSKGVIQGYTGITAVDAKHQIIVCADAHGSGSEQEALLPMVARTGPYRTPDTLITADAGYHSEANLQQLQEQGIPALIADGLMRKRDPRLAAQGKHQTKPHPLHDKRPAKPASKFQPKDFSYDPIAQTCVCPAGKALYSNGNHCTVNGRTHHKFQGSHGACGPCDLRARCLRHPDKTPTRQVSFFYKQQASPLPHTERMKQAIDSPEGRKRKLPNTGSTVAILCP